MRRLFLVPIICAVLVLATASAAFACGSLIGPNGAVHLVRTSTLAAWHDGVEHYVTNFEFASNQTSFGSIIPLPAEPTTVERGGDWTLQRLARRPDGSSPATSPRRRPAPAASTCSSRHASTRSTSRSCAAAARPSPTGPRSRASTRTPSAWSGAPDSAPSAQYVTAGVTATYGPAVSRLYDRIRTGHSGRTAADLHAHSAAQSELRAPFAEDFHARGLEPTADAVDAEMRKALANSAQAKALAPPLGAGPVGGVG